MVALYIALGYGVAAIVGHFLMTSFFPIIAIGDKPSIIEMVFVLLIAFLLSLLGGFTAYQTQKWVAILSPCLLIVIVGPIPLFFIAHVPLFYSVAWPTIIGLFILIFQFVRRYEDLPVGQGALELVHRRYLEYWRSFVWLMIFGGVSGVIWVVNTFRAPRPPDVDIKIFVESFAIPAIQVAIVGGLGFFMVSWAFNKKLMEIEEALSS